MATYLGKSCSFGLPRVPFINSRQFMYLVISHLVLRAGCGIIAYLFTLHCKICIEMHSVIRKTVTAKTRDVCIFTSNY